MVRQLNFSPIFFYILRTDLLVVVEESQKKGHVSGSFNTTFIGFIPKISKTESFKEYRPIYLCNVVYKIITKIISNWIKPYLEKCKSKEQFGFLSNIQTQDAVEFSHEGIHSIKIKKIKSLNMKMDFTKAYDRVDWVYL